MSNLTSNNNKPHQTQGNQLSNRSSEEQIRQRIRLQLQQRLPTLAQQLQPGDGSDRNSNSFGGGLGTNVQSFGGGVNGREGQIQNSGEGGSADYFNSDSFRAIGTNSQDNRMQERVLDLSHHRQPFSNTEDAGIQEEEDKQDYCEDDDVQGLSSSRRLGQQDNRQLSARNAVSNDQMSPINYEEFQFQQNLIEDLVHENQVLRDQLEETEAKLVKAEQQFKKSKQMIKELEYIKGEIDTIKKSGYDEQEDADKLATENEILKSKIQDLETRVNTLSRVDNDTRLDEKFRFEKVIQQIKDENRLLADKYRVSQQHILKADEEIIKYKSLLQARDQEIQGIHTNWKQLHEDFANSIKEQKILQTQNEELKKAAREHMGSNKQIGVQKINAKEYSIEEPASQRDFASLRNKSLSGDQGQDEWMNQINDQVEKEFSDRAEKGLLGVRYINEKAKAANDSQIKSDHLSQDMTKAEYNDAQNVSSIYHVASGNKLGYQNPTQGLVGQTYQNNINVKNYQPIQITIASPTDQTMALAERCQKLEEYCRELIRTNKILDCENRIAVAQILHLTDPKNQLQNLTAALSFIGKSGKIYDNKKSQSLCGLGARTTNNLNRKSSKENISFNQGAGFKQQMSLRNLNALRQVGAPPINQVFQNNNSSFIVQKFNGMLQSDSNRNFASSEVVAGRNHMRDQLMNYHSSLSNGGMSRPSQRGTLEVNGTIQGTAPQQAYFSQSSSENHRHNHNQARMNPIFVGQEENQNLPTFQDRNQNIGSPVISESENIYSLDLHLNELQKEIEEKDGNKLHLRKVTDGYYCLGHDNIINLRLDENSQRILIRVQANENQLSKSQGRDSQVNHVSSTMFVDFIDFLIQERYIRAEETAQ